MSDYLNWQDLMDEEVSEEDLQAEATAGAQEAIDDIGDPTAMVQGALSEGLAPVQGVLDKAQLPGGLEAIASAIPGMGELFEKRDALRAQLEQLTGNKGQPAQDSRFPFLDGPRQPLGSGDPKQKTRAQQPSATASSRRDEQRDIQRDAARWGGGAASMFEAFDQEPEGSRDDARDTQRHLLAFKRTEERMARARGAGTGGRALSRAELLRKQHLEQTERMRAQREQLIARRDRLRGGNARQQRRAGRVDGRAQRMNQRVQRRDRTDQAWLRQRDKMREKQAAMKRSQQRMKNKHMRIRNGAAWMATPRLSSLTSGEMDFSTFVKRLPLKQIGRSIRDGKMDIGWPFQRDKEAEERRRAAQERRRRERMEKRRREKAEQDKRDEERGKKGKKRDGDRKNDGGKKRDGGGGGRGGGKKGGR